MRIALLLALLVVLAAPAFAQDAEDIIPLIMHRVYKEGLYSRIVENKSTEKDEWEFYWYVQQLRKQTPPEGPEAGWRERVGRLEFVAKKVYDGDDRYRPLVRRYSDCKACHSRYRD